MNRPELFVFFQRVFQPSNPKLDALARRIDAKSEALGSITNTIMATDQLGQKGR